VIDVLPGGTSLVSEGESEAEISTGDDPGSATDQAILNLDDRTIAEQSSDSAVDAAAGALAGDDSPEDDEFDELLEALAAE